MPQEAKHLPEIVEAPRTDPIYNCHAYLTKVPISAIEPFIQAFTEPGEVVVDFFAGSGMTGLAALRTGREARLSDISVLGRHIAKGYAAEVQGPAFLDAASIAMRQAREAIGGLYTTIRETDDTPAEMVRTVWSFTYVCPSCASELVYYHEFLRAGGVPKFCPSCGGPFARRNWRRRADVPVEVVVRGPTGRLVEQAVAKFDVNMIEKAATDPRQKDIPSLPIEDFREMYSRSGLGKAGLTQTAQFFSPRNALALFELWNAINEIVDENVRQKLRFAFTAILPRASRRYQWSPQRPLNAQNQTYYIAPVYYEWNIFELFNRKVDAAIRSDAALFGKAALSISKSHKEIPYDLASADNLKHLEGASIDYVFTDPPFGSNIFYSDMNLFHEAWLGDVTDHASEAVVHTTGKRKQGAAERYEDLLRRAFVEANRVLKPGHYMSVVFGNSNGKIWGLVQRALRDAGFKHTPSHVAILDKGQRSVKGLNSGAEGVVTVDLILTVQKPAESEKPENGHDLCNGDTADLIREAICELSTDKAKNPSYVYARTLKKAIEKYYVLDNLHLGDVLIALRNAGYSVNRKTGLIEDENRDRPHLISPNRIRAGV